MLKPIEIDGTPHHCTHRASWPPPLEGFPDAHVRELSEAMYEQIKVWKRVCGLKAMDAAKCSTCPLVLRETPGGLVPANKVNVVDRVTKHAIGRFGKSR